MQVGEGEQVHIEAGRVHSVATLDPRVCLSLYSTAAFGKGKEDRKKKKVVDQAADRSTKAYVSQKRKYRKAAEEAEEAADPQKYKKKKNKRK